MTKIIFFHETQYFFSDEGIKLVYFFSKNGHTFNSIYSNSLSTNETDSMDEDNPRTPRTRGALHLGPYALPQHQEPRRRHRWDHLDHPDYTQMATKCVRLGHKVSKAVELRILRVIQECQICKDEDRTFSHGHGKKYKTAFNTDILVVRREKVIGDYYYTDLFSLECMDTGLTIARYVNRNKFESRYEMLNFVALEYWSYGENGDSFGMPRNAFFTSDPTDDIQSLRRAGRTNGNKWGRSDLKLGKFRFSDFLDCTDCAEIKT